MVDANLRAANPDNYQLPGKVSVWVRSKGSAEAADWRELGNIIDPSLAPTIETLQHFSQRRGRRSKDREEISGRSVAFNLTLDEINLDNLKYMFASDEDPTDSTVDVHESKTFPNPGGTAPNNTVTLGDEEIDPDTMIVRNAALEEDATPFVEDTDYSVDYGTGIVTILPGGALNDEADVTTLHFQYVRNVETVKFTGWSGNLVEVECKFQVLTTGGLQYVITAANATIKNNGDFTIGDGQDWQKIPITIEVLEDTNGEMVNIHVIDAEEL